MFRVDLFIWIDFWGLYDECWYISVSQCPVKSSCTKDYFVPLRDTIFVLFVPMPLKWCYYNNSCICLIEQHFYKSLMPQPHNSFLPLFYYKHLNVIKADWIVQLNCFFISLFLYQCTNALSETLVQLLKENYFNKCQGSNAYHHNGDFKLNLSPVKHQH